MMREELFLVIFLGLTASLDAWPIATKEMIKDLLKAGMNIARLNFSHDSHVEHEQRIAMIREAVTELENETKLSYHLAIALDTKGPEIRTGTLRQGIGNKIELKTGDQIKLTVLEDDIDNCSDQQIYISYQRLPQIIDLERHLIYIDDGKIILKPIEIEGDQVICEISQGGLLGSRKGVVLPGVDLDLPAVSDKDILDLQFGVKHDVDIIFASFIQDAAGVEAVRNVLGEIRPDICVVAKIETQKALKHIDEIIEASDGIMVARGDLAVHTPITRVFQAQKFVIAKCIIAGKPVICATQMLESMMDELRPSRSDVSDVANAVLDGADGVMLSGETAVGKYPVKCVETMAEICKYAEMTVWHKRMLEELTNQESSLFRTCNRQKGLQQKIGFKELTAAVGVYESLLVNASAIIITFPCVYIEKFITKYRTHCPIITTCSSEGRSRKVSLYKGIHAVPIEVEGYELPVNTVQTCLEYAKNQGIIQKEDFVVIASFEPGSHSNSMVTRCLIVD